MLEKIKLWAVEQALWAEKNMKGKTGKEKRDAVIQKLDDMIKLPPLLEPFDGPIIGFFVDLAVSKLNAVIGHKFGEAKVTEEQEHEIAKELDVSDEMAESLNNK